MGTRPRSFLRRFGIALAFAAGALAATTLSQAFDWPFQERSEAPPEARPAPAEKSGPPISGALPSFADITARAKDAVVNISTATTVKRGQTLGPFGGPVDPNDPFQEFFRRFVPEMPKSFKRRSLGSGFVVSADGFIVTNHHVVDGADEIVVKLPENSHEYRAKLVGSDPKTDLAVLKIEPKRTLSTLRLGDSSRLRVGDWVLAIGNPFGLEESVTAGIVSATGRMIGQGPYDDFIQTDASINPGNSGGPLLDLQGEVVGINSAIFSRSGGNIGIGFAIPANLARSVIDQLRDKGKVVRGWLGLMIQDVTEDLAQSFGLSEPHGALVAEVQENSPGEKAGIERGDVIVSYDGRDVKASRDLPALVAATAIGKRVDIELLRDGAKKSVTATIAEMPAEAVQAGGEGAESSGEKLGLVVSPVTPEIARQLGAKPGEGVAVQAVRSGSAAEEAGLRPGDVILEVDRKAVKSVDQFKSAVARRKEGESLLFLVRRGDSTIFLALRKSS